MGIRLTGYDEVSEERARLPAGGYVCQILAAHIEQVFERPQLQLLIDIAEGEYKNYFALQQIDRMARDKNYWSRSALFKRYIFDDGNKITRGFKSLLKAVESSNAGYVIDKADFEADSLINKICGFTFGAREYEYNGRIYLTAEVKYPYAAAQIRSGDYRIPAIEELRRAAQPEDSPF